MSRSKIAARRLQRFSIILHCSILQYCVRNESGIAFADWLGKK